MNWDEIKGSWRELRGRVREQWGQLTDDDVTSSLDGVIAWSA